MKMLRGLSEWGNRQGFFPPDFHLEACRKTAESNVRLAGGTLWQPRCCQRFPTRHLCPQMNHSSKRYFIIAALKRREGGF